MTKFVPGTVSHGTHNTYDLANAFLEALAPLAPAVYQQLVFPCGMAPDYLRAIDDGRTNEYWGSEAAHEFVNELQDALNEHAPAGYYFGAHEGDGSDFGFWETEEHAAEREWAEFTAELSDIHSSKLAKLRATREVNLSDDSLSNSSVDHECTHFVVFSFGAYGYTYVAVPYAPSGFHPGVDIQDALEAAAGWLADHAPGMFTDVDMDAARDEMLADGELTAEEHADRDSDEVDCKVHEHATADLTHTESGWLHSWEWTIVGEAMTRAELLAFARGE